MKIPFIISVVTIVLLQVSVTFTQEAAAFNAKSKEAASIFNTIMQSLPEDLKATVDSVSTIREIRNDPASTGRQNDGTHTLKTNDSVSSVMLDDLPKDILAQVQKTLKEIESQQIVRMLEFKELNQNK